MPEFTFHTIDNSSGDTRAVLEEVQSQYGFIPSLFNYMAEAPVTIRAYIEMNDRLLSETGFSAGQLQVALLAVSQYNDCNFCTVAHQAMAKRYGALPQSVAAVAHGGDIEDPQDKAIVAMVLSIVRHRGWVPEEDFEAFFAAGFSRKHFLELHLVSAIKTLSNYINHVTKPEPNPELVKLAGR